MQRTQATFFSILSVCLALLTFLQAPPVEAENWHPLETEAVMAEARNVTPAGYPDADVVVVDQQTWTRYAPDGTYEEWFEQYVKVLTEKGRRGYRTLTSSFTIPYNTTRFDLVEVISQDGTIRTVDVGKNSREMVDSSQMASNIYDPNDRLLQVSVPEVGIGDTVHFITYDAFAKARMAGEFSDYTTFEGTDPIRHALNTIVAPSGKPLMSIALKNEIPGTVGFHKTRTGEEVIYRWTARDIPRAFVEPEMPPLYTQAQRLLVSTIPDWQTISRWYWNLSRPHLARTTPEMRSTVDKLIKGKRTRQAKIEAIFSWVSQEVRYLGITAETEAPGYEPHPVSMTYDRRAGVCRDKAALLVAMLRLAGMEAYPVLIMNGPKKDPEVPQPFFNHAIAGVRNKDGTYMLMDPTDENTREMLPSYLNNQSFLVATPGGETLRTSPTDPADANMMKISTTGSLDERGTLHGTTTLSFQGINDNAYRGHFSMLSDSERRYYFERTLRKVLPSASLKGLTIKPADMMDTAETLEVALEYIAEKYPVKGGKVTLLPMFRFGDTMGLTNYMVQRMGLKERKYTYVTETTCGVEETLSIRLDPSLGSPLGKPLQEAAIDEGATWIRSLEVDGGMLRGKNLFQMKLTEYSPDQYKKLQDTLKRVEKANRFMTAFSPEPVPADGASWYEGFRPDAVILDEDTFVRIVDPATQTETITRKVKVLTYAGKKSFSELQIPFNPVWEEVKLEKAVVFSPRGDVKEIDPREVNVMDQEWAGKAPRYPAGKVLVASLPGLEEGSTIEYRYVRTRRDNPAFLITGTFQGEHPIENKRLRIVAPDGIELHSMKEDTGFHGDSRWSPFAGGAVSETRSRDKGLSVIEYSARYIPPIKPEDNLGPGYSFMPAVFASSFRGKAVLGEVLGALEKAARGGVLSAQKAREITRGIPDEELKIVAVRDFVARSIKAVGIPISQLPLSQISPADTTLGDGYGHRADVAVLLSAMLGAIGYEPQFVLVSTAPAVASLRRPFLESPAMEWYAAVLVKIRTGKGEVYLGDTDQYSALGAVAGSGSLGLNLTTGEFETIQATSEQFKDRTDYQVSIDLNADGDAVVTNRRTYFGMDHARFSRDHAEMTPEEQRRRYQEIVSSVSRAAVATGPWTVSTDRYPA
ncbi:MAG: DUF3857 domain-containing protein, partial [Desulfobacterota bacterium]|nr:DUF3857 domain-containing protein [Thermodesulfobacteriota bacterium]